MTTTATPTKPAKKHRHLVTSGIKHETPNMTTFSSDLLTPEEERELLNSFWETKRELVKEIVRHFRELRQHAPPMEPWPMANFIREHCDKPHVRSTPNIHRKFVLYVHLKHRLASAN